MAFIVITDAFNTYQYFIFNLLQAKNFKKILERLAAVDLIFCGFEDGNKNSVFKYTVVFIVYTLLKTVFITNFGLTVTDTQTTTLQLVAWYVFVVLSTAVTLLSECQFLTLVLLLYQRFKQVNQVLVSKNKKDPFGKCSKNKEKLLLKLFLQFWKNPLQRMVF